MSITDARKTKALEQQVAELMRLVEQLTQRLEALENKRGPGRPKKDG